MTQAQPMIQRAYYASDDARELSVGTGTGTEHRSNNNDDHNAATKYYYSGNNTSSDNVIAYSESLSSPHCCNRATVHTTDNSKATDNTDDDMDTTQCTSKQVDECNSKQTDKCDSNEVDDTDNDNNDMDITQCDSKGADDNDNDDDGVNVAQCDSKELNSTVDTDDDDIDTTQYDSKEVDNSNNDGTCNVQCDGDTNNHREDNNSIMEVQHDTQEASQTITVSKYKIDDTSLCYCPICMRVAEPADFSNTTETSDDDRTAVLPGNGNHDDTNDHNSDDNSNPNDQFCSPPNKRIRPATLSTAPPKPQKPSSNQVLPRNDQQIRFCDRAIFHRLSSDLTVFSLKYLRATADEQRQLPGLNAFHLSRIFDGLITIYRNENPHPATGQRHNLVQCLPYVLDKATKMLIDGMSVIELYNIQRGAK